MPRELNPVRPSSTGSRLIAVNTLWGSIDSISSLLISVLSSVLLARAFGPAKMGNYNFVVWAAGLSGTLGSLSLPVVTRKYIAEYMSRGEPGLAKAVYSFTLRMQAALAVAIACIGILTAVYAFEPGQRLLAVVLFSSIVPQLVGLIPTQVNNAMENFSANMPGSLGGLLTFFCGVLLSLNFGWDLLGVATGIFVSTLVEAVLKFVSVRRLMQALPTIPLPSHLRARIVGFSRQNVALAVLTIIVFERSDVLLLRLLHPDHRQIAFFSIPFNFVEKILILPKALAGAIGAGVMSEFSRDFQRTRRIAELAFKYLLLSAAPMLVGLAVISTPLIEVFYGPAYRPASSVLAIIALLGIAKSLMGPVQALCFATEDLGIMLRLTLASGVVNALLDVLLIPLYGALGAAIGAGVAQALVVFFFWRHAIRTFNLALDYRFVAKITLSVALMAIAVISLVSVVTPMLALVIGVAAGVAVFVLVARRIALLNAQDRSHLLSMSLSLGAAKRLNEWLVNLLFRKNASQTPAVPVPATD